MVRMVYQRVRQVEIKALFQIRRRNASVAALIEAMEP